MRKYDGDDDDGDEPHVQERIMRLRSQLTLVCC